MKLKAIFRRSAHDPITAQLDAAAARNEQTAQDSDQAHAMLAAAVEAEQDQIRRNSLGHAVRAALFSRRRHP